MSAERDEIRRQLGHGQGGRRDIGEMTFSVKHITPIHEQDKREDEFVIVNFAWNVDFYSKEGE